MSFETCAQVSVNCPVEATLFGYRPDLAANAVLVALFSACCLINIILGIRWKWWSYLIALSSGCALETIGYVGRILLHRNPYDTTAFSIQFICLVIAPAFIAAGLYLGLKHLVIRCGREKSLLPPALYTWIFISTDITTLILQAIGAVLATTVHKPTTLRLGTNIALAGIILQVIALVFFGLLAAIFLWRNKFGKGSKDRPLVAPRDSTRLRLFIFGQSIAYLTILIRCIYRIPEISSGFDSHIFRNELDFMFLDGFMMAVGAVTLSAFHPGFLLMAHPTSSTELNEDDKQSC